METFVEKDCKWGNIPFDFVQNFRQPVNVRTDKEILYRMVENGGFSEDDVKLCIMLVRHRFATFEQLHRYCIAERMFDCDPDKLAKALRKLQNERVAGIFCLTDHKLGVGEQPPRDALWVYCPMMGAVSLSENFNTDPTIADWKVSDVQKISQLIMRNLAMTEFMLRVKETCPERLKSFYSVPKYSIGNGRVVPAAQAEVETNGKKYYLILDVFSRWDSPTETQQRVSRIESLVTTNHWKRYFPDLEDAPVFMPVCDSDETALSIAKMIADTTQITRYRITTQDRMDKNLSEPGAFLSYTDHLEEITAKMFA